jgi:hypothetical protein
MLSVFSFACDDEKAEKAADVDFGGSYLSVGQWDLSGPLANDQSIGHHAAVIFVERVVSGLAVPSLLADRAEDAVRSIVYDPIRNAVDAQVPSELAPGGAVYGALAMALGSAEVISRLELVQPDDGFRVEGTETITTINVPWDGGTVSVDVDALSLEGEELVALRTDVDAQMVESTTRLNVEPHESTTRLNVEPHIFALHFERLVNHLSIELLDFHLLDEVEAFIGAWDCEALADAIGGPSLSIEIAGQQFELGAETLSDACAAAITAISDRALGFLRSDIGVEIGGEVIASDVTEDGRVHTLENGPSYGGAYVGLPASFDPVIQIIFQAERE